MLKQILLGITLLAILQVTTVWADDVLNQKLFTASANGDSKQVEELIKEGASVNAKNNSRTPLYTAGNKDVAEVLIAQGADVNVKDIDGKTPLYQAVWWGDKDVVEILIAHGADVNAKDINGDNLLDNAVARDNKDVAEILITHGADVNAKGVNGGNPLGDANSKDMAELLIAHGADVNAKDIYGDNPLEGAVGRGNKDVAEILITHGADVKAKDNNGTTLLEIASKIGDAKIQQEITTMLLAVNQSNPGESLNHSLEQFKGHSDNDGIRTSIINLVMKMQPAPAIPPEAQAAADRAQYMFKDAKSMDDTLNVAKEYLTAVETAPWVANYYYDICMVLQKTPYLQEALHACKYYLIASPNAVDANDMKQRIVGLQYAVDKNKLRAKQRTTYSKAHNTGLYSLGGQTGQVAGHDVSIKLSVDWQAAPPKYQVMLHCSDETLQIFDLVNTDTDISLCGTSMHLVIKSEGEGFVELGDANIGSIRMTLDDLFKLKQKAFDQAVMFSASDDQGEHFYVPYVFGGAGDKYSGWAMYESNCNGDVLKQDPRALPDDFIPLERTNKGDFGKFNVETSYTGPNEDMCSSQFAQKTGYRFGEKE